MKRLEIADLMLTIIFGIFPSQPKAEAIDPVTIAILTPIAIKAAKIAAPYVIRGLISGGKGMLLMGGNILEILLLPWGALQCTVGVPFGMFGHGMSNVIQGGIAPFKLAWNSLLLPIRFFGVGI